MPSSPRNDSCKASKIRTQDMRNSPSVEQRIKDETTRESVRFTKNSKNVLLGPSSTGFVPIVRLFLQQGSCSLGSILLKYFIAEPLRRLRTAYIELKAEDVGYWS